MVYKLNSSDLKEHLSNLGESQAVANRRGGADILKKEKLGDLSLRAYSMPGIEAMELGWRIPGNSILISDTHTLPTDLAINISFQLQGSMVTRFGGIGHPMDMKTGVHNLVYLTENNNDSHIMEANQQLSAFSITIDKHYFVSCIAADDRWSNDVISKIEKNIPFAAAEKSPGITPRMHYLIQRIRQDTQAEPMRKLLLQSRLLEVIALQIEQYGSTCKANNAHMNAEDRQKLFVLKNYINHHFLADLSLAQLSRISMLNEFKLKRGFKSEFGETVFGYIRKLRMQHAGNLLHDTSLSVNEIATLLGYEHAHHFAKAFKDHTGYLPANYRKKMNDTDG